MPIETFPIGPLETNCHIVISGSDAVAVDPGGDLNSGLGEVLALLKEQNLTLRAILCTHFHFDHLYGVAALHEATGAPVYGPARGCLPARHRARRQRRMGLPSGDDVPMGRFEGRPAHLRFDQV